VAALGAGASAILKGEANSAVKDAYAALKSLIMARISAENIASLEEDPDSKSRRMAVENELERVDAAHDPDLVRASERLLSLLEGRSRRVGLDLSGVVVGGDLIIRDSISRLGQADPHNVQEIAASQLQLLSGYHQIALAQSRRSFFWALVGSGIGFALFCVAVSASLLTGLALASVVPLVAGAVVQVVSGIVFFLYGKTSDQLSMFHSRLEILQRYLLANSICEALSAEEKDKARTALIHEITKSQPVQKS
jgi:hypothetical protein